MASTRSSRTSKPERPIHVQCSMVSTPAATAAAMPSVPWACAATGNPELRASATIRLSSSGVNCACQLAGPPLVMPPPVAMTLMRSTPAAALRRTAVRIASLPWTSPPMNQQCPPGTVSGVPADSSRGPGTRPAAISSRRRTASPPRSPRSRAVVTPVASNRPAGRPSRRRARRPRLPAGRPRGRDRRRARDGRGHR